jgi:Autophagy-related protein 101
MTVTIPVQLRIEKRYLNDCLKAILHSILFHRTFSLIKPKEDEIFDLIYPRLDSQQIEDLINGI